MALMVDYWLADRLGRVWLGLHKGLRGALGEMPGECALVASGEQLSARRLYQVQGFATRVWWRAGMAVFLLVSPIAVALTASIPGAAGTDIGVSVALAGGCLAGVGMLEMGLLSFRCGQTRLYLAHSAREVGEEPLPAGHLGLPSRLDFWVMLFIALATFAILVYAAGLR
jgi:hypothetical protein